MYILITYDVETISSEGQRRLRNVAKICKNYGQRVQNSVFECEVTEAQYCILREEILNTIDNEADSIRIYHLNRNKSYSIESYGKKTSYTIDDALIL